MRSYILPTTLKKLWKQYHQIEDLTSWKNWLVDVLSVVFIFIIPIPLIVVFPVLIEKGQFLIIIIDIALWLILVIRFIAPSIGTRFSYYPFLGIIISMTAGFFIMMGPGYARPAWLIASVVMVTIFAGTLKGLLLILFNAVFLFSLYYFADQSIPAWQQTRIDGLTNWIIFIVNTSALSILAAVSTGFIIIRLNTSLENMRNNSTELQAAMEELTATNEEFEAINEELMDSQERLRVSEAQYRELAEMLPLTIFETNTRAELTYINNNALNTFGYTREELKSGVTIISCIAPDYRRKSIETFNQLSKGIISDAGEYVLLRKDGTQFPAIIYGSPIYHDGKFTGTRGAIIDISARVDLENENRKVHEQLLQAQKMEAIGTLAGGIAHDFNNILTGIIGYSEIAMHDSENEDVKETLSHVLQFSSRAADLVRQILSLSRKHKHEKKPVSIAHIINDAVKILRASIPSTIEIKFHNNAVNDTVLADSTEMLQAIMNLGTNAAHAMNERGGVLTFSISNPEERDNHSGMGGSPVLEIRVNDTGSGIPENVITNIFDQFFTTKAHGEGTGLGLSITRNIIKDCGGDITVTSRIHEGTTFSITLPACTEETASPEEEGKDKHRPGSGHILVVDDEAALANMEKTILENLGYTVDVCSSGIDALDKFNSDPGRYDLIITDQTMPHITGAELSVAAHKIRQDIPVLLCTGYSEQVSADNAGLFQIDAILYKPLNSSVLADEVNRLIGKKNLHL